MDSWYVESYFYVAKSNAAIKDKMWCPLSFMFCICVGFVPLTENMPGGKATKPGDVVTSMSGKTIQVLKFYGLTFLLMHFNDWSAQWRFFKMQLCKLLMARIKMCFIFVKNVYTCVKIMCFEKVLYFASVPDNFLILHMVIKLFDGPKSWGRASPHNRNCSIILGQGQMICWYSF